jgi:putative oxidoreductase
MATIKTRQASAARRPVNVRDLVALQENYHVRSVVLFLARLALAAVFMYHGAGKLFNFKNQGGIAGTAAFFKLEGIPAPHLFAYVGGITEFLGGLLLLVGLAVPLAGLALALDMLLALLIATVNTGMLNKALPGGIVADGMQINLALGAAALLLAALGAGRFSLDYALGLAWRPAD